MNVEFNYNKRSREEIEPSALRKGSFEARKVTVREPEEEEQVCTVPLHIALRIKDDEFMQRASFYSRCTKFTLCKGTYISDNAMVVFLSGRTLLHTIELYNCPNISDNTLWALRTNCSKIRKVTIVGCPITDEGIAALCSYRRNIQELDLTSCPKLTDKSLITIAHHLHDLVSISLSNNSQFSLGAFKELIWNCKKLEKLDLWSCKQVTDEWLDVVNIWGSQIASIDVGSCPNLTVYNDCPDKD